MAHSVEEEVVPKVAAKYGWSEEVARTKIRKVQEILNLKHPIDAIEFLLATIINPTNSSVVFITFADSVGTTKAVGPFSDEELAKKWEQAFWLLFYERFKRENQHTPVSEIHEINFVQEPPAPAEFLKQMSDQDSTGEFLF